MFSNWRVSVCEQASDFNSGDSIQFDLICFVCFSLDSFQFVCVCLYSFRFEAYSRGSPADEYC